MLISSSFKLIANHINVSTPTTCRSASALDLSRARLPFIKSPEFRKNSEIQLRLRLAALWLTLLAEVALLGAGIFYLAKSDKMREAESERLLRSAAEGPPTYPSVTLDEALQAFGARR
jgi:hypothetical protein